MAMPAIMWKLRDKGPQATKCYKCGSPFTDGMLIEGPTRARKDDYGRVRSDYNGPEFWHMNCSRPFGWNPITNADNAAPTQPTQPRVILGEPNNTWQRETLPTPTPTPAIAPAPATEVKTQIADTQADQTQAELITGIISAINANLAPKIKAAVEELQATDAAQQTEIDITERRVDTLRDVTVNHTNHLSDHTRDIASLTQELKDANAQLTSQAQILKVIQQSQPIQIHLHDPKTHTTTTHNLDRQHQSFPKLLARIAAGKLNIWITGPAGSGKSTAVAKVAEALGYHFEVVPMVSDPTDLLGFMNATRYSPTNFYRAYTGNYPQDTDPNAPNYTPGDPAILTPEQNTLRAHGTILLLDEIDAWDARAGLAVNGALANGHCAFPHGTFKRLPNLIIVATANTWGFGSDDQHVGRNKLDATTLDRFGTIPWDYDEAFEKSLAGYGLTHTGTDALRQQDIQRSVDSYVDAVIATRHKAREIRAKISITPRASIDGAMLLRAGLSRADVIEDRFERYRSNDKWLTCGQPIEDWAKKGT